MKYYHGSCVVIENLLLEAAQVIWEDYLKNGRTQTIPHKNRFMDIYQRCCYPMLLGIIKEWFYNYGCEGAYQDFYAMKLWKVAKLILYGESKPNQLRQFIHIKPDVRLHFFYDSDAWERLGE